MICMWCFCKKSVKMESINLIRSPLKESPSRNRTIEHSPPREVFVQAQRPPSPPRHVEMQNIHDHTYYEQPVHRHVEPIVHRHVEPKVHRHVEPQQNVRRVVGEPIVTYSKVHEPQNVSVSHAHVRETR